MSVVIKTVAGREYAYWAYRTGDKVVHEYLGPLSKPGVLEKVRALRSEKVIPKLYHPLFWDAEPERIDVKRQYRYILERVLELGDLGAFQWIQKLYPTRWIIEICASSRKISPKSKAFWEIWLGVRDAR